MDSRRRPDQGTVLLVFGSTLPKSLAFLSPELIEAILQGRQPVALTATRLTELDLPLDWTEQHKQLAG